MLELCRNRCRVKQRTDARTAKFLRPKFAQMIQRQSDAHNGLLAQGRNSREGSRALPSTLRRCDPGAMINIARWNVRSTKTTPSVNRNSHDNRDQGDPCAHLRE